MRKLSLFIFGIVGIGAIVFFALRPKAPSPEDYEDEEELAQEESAPPPPTSALPNFKPTTEGPPSFGPTETPPGQPPKEKLRLEVAVAPRNAKIELNGQELGRSRFFGHIPYGPQHTLRVSHPGYEPQSFTFQQEPPPKAIVLKQLGKAKSATQ